MNTKYDIFISYPRSEDEKLQYEYSVKGEEIKKLGWVGYFQEEFERLLRLKYKNYRPKVFRDEYEIKGNEHIFKKINKALEDANIMIVISCPRYFTRSEGERNYCKEEYDKFVAFASDSQKLFPINIRQADAEFVFQSMHKNGYDFISPVNQNPLDPVNEKQLYLKAMEKLVDDVVAFLLKVRNDDKKSSSLPKVFLAPTHASLKTQWWELHNKIHEDPDMELVVSEVLSPAQLASESYNVDELDKCDVSVQLLAPISEKTPKEHYVDDYHVATKLSKHIKTVFRIRPGDNRPDDVEVDNKAAHVNIDGKTTKEVFKIIKAYFDKPKKNLIVVDSLGVDPVTINLIKNKVLKFRSNSFRFGWAPYSLIGKVYKKSAAIVTIYGPDALDLAERTADIEFQLDSYEDSWERELRWGIYFEEGKELSELQYIPGSWNDEYNQLKSTEDLSVFLSLVSKKVWELHAEEF